MQLLRNGVDRTVIAPYADIGLTAIRLGVRSASREMGFAKPRPGELTHSASPQADDRSRRDAESRSDSVGVGNRLRRDETNRCANRRRNDHLDDSRPDTGAGVLRNHEGTEPFEKAGRVAGIDLTPNPSPFRRGEPYFSRDSSSGSLRRACSASFATLSSAMAVFSLINAFLNRRMRIPNSESAWSLSAS